MTRLTIATIAIMLCLAGSASAQQEQVLYYHTDALGSVRMITDATGQVVERHDYLPFGQEYLTGSTERRLFTGAQRDQETEFDYFGSRYYASGIGRFTTVDPGHVNGDVSDPQSWNAYAYARNNPLKYTDSTGTAYEICPTDEKGNPVNCTSVSDQKFGYLAQNPGAGLRLDGNAIYAGGRIAGYYRQTSVDGFDSFAAQTGNLAVAYAKATAKEYAKQAAITAGTFGLGVAFQVSVEVMLASRLPVVFKTGHYAARLLAAGVNVDRTEIAVQQLIRNGAPLQGTLRSDGILVEYRAARLADGQISVGTIFPKR